MCGACVWYMYVVCGGMCGVGMWYVCGVEHVWFAECVWCMWYVCICMYECESVYVRVCACVFEGVWVSVRACVRLQSATLTDYQRN